MDTAVSTNERGGRQPFEDLVELSARKYGSAVVYATDDYFAEKDNLLNPEPAVFLDGKYTHRGKWMDGWESRRKRVVGHDFAVVRLGLPGVISGIIVDTAFFRGNFPESCSIEGCYLPGQPTVDELLSPDRVWTPLVAKQTLKGDHRNAFAAAEPLLVTHLRLAIYPDGGVARLRVHGQVLAAPRAFGRVGFEPEIDLASVELGASVVACNDMFFGSRHNLISTNRAETMGDGWETKRSRKWEPDWAVLKLAARGSVHRAVIDTLHFRGNFPESASLEGIDWSGKPSVPPQDAAWLPILERTKLQEHTLHDYEDAVLFAGAVTHVRMRIWPDGGISRLRLIGRVSPDDKAAASLAFINALPLAARASLLSKVTASSSWADHVAKQAPFASFENLTDAAERTFATLSREDWLAAFAGHPRIGEKKPNAEAMGEQSRANAGSAELKAKLLSLNAAYEAKFGRVFLICATGLALETIVAEAERRLQCTDDAEFETAKQEQIKIAKLRLAKLVRRTES
jgi:allantoicase